MYLTRCGHRTVTYDMKSHADHMIPLIAVYKDESPGARAEVILVSTTNDAPARPTGNDSGYYGDILGRHGNMGNSKWGRESVSSSLSSDSGNHDNENGEEFIMGTVGVPPEISWVAMDSKVEWIVMVNMMERDATYLCGSTIYRFLP